MTNGSSQLHKKRGTTQGQAPQTGSNNWELSGSSGQLSPSGSMAFASWRPGPPTAHQQPPPMHLQSSNRTNCPASKPRECLLKKRPNRTTYQSMHGGRASIIVERSSLHLVVTERTLIVQLPRKRMLNAGGGASLVDGNQWIDFGCSIARPGEA